MCRHFAGYGEKFKPTTDSKINFEVWMPAAGWNGKFEQLGNGGLAGSINQFALAGPLKKGFATAATDDGHEGAPTDASWAIGHPEKVKDFGYRAVHETNLKAKRIIAAFYQKPPRYSYFNGCSEGGREALMEAQRFPEDFNGILAGATAHYWTQLMAAFAWNAQALSTTASFIRNPKGMLFRKPLWRHVASKTGWWTSSSRTRSIAVLIHPRCCVKGPTPKVVLVRSNWRHSRRFTLARAIRAPDNRSHQGMNRGQRRSRECREFHSPAMCLALGPE